MPRFKVGDKIRCTTDGGSAFHKGGVYVVKEVIPHDYGRGRACLMVEEDDRGSRYNGWSEEWFEPLDLTPGSVEAYIQRELHGDV